MLNVELKEVVMQFQMTLAASAEFNDVAIIVEDDEEDMLLLELPNHGYSIELRFEDEEVGIAKGVVSKLHYRCCYPKVVYGGYRGYWEPEYVDIVEFADCTSVQEACIAIVANSYAQRIDGIGECFDFERAYEQSR